jgi:transposase
MEVAMSMKPVRLTEFQILRIQGGALIEQGDSHQEIAAMLNRSLATVRGWRNIVRKQGVAALAPKP